MTRTPPFDGGSPPLFPTVDLSISSALPHRYHRRSRTLEEGRDGEGYTAGSPPGARRGVENRSSTVGTVGDAVTSVQIGTPPLGSATVGNGGVRPDQLPDDTRYRWTERAGIAEHVGGLDREAAERLAWSEILGGGR